MKSSLRKTSTFLNRNFLVYTLFLVWVDPEKRYSILPVSSSDDKSRSSEVYSNEQDDLIIKIQASFFDWRLWYCHIHCQIDFNVAWLQGSAEEELLTLDFSIGLHLNDHNWKYSSTYVKVWWMPVLLTCKQVHAKGLLLSCLKDVVVKKTFAHLICSLTSYKSVGIIL